MDNIFTKYDVDGSNVLDRRELKLWMSDEIGAKPLRKKVAQKSFTDLIQAADANGDGKIDRWEMFDYCLKTYKEDDL